MSRFTTLFSALIAGAVVLPLDASLANSDTPQAVKNERRDRNDQFWGQQGLPHQQGGPGQNPLWNMQAPLAAPAAPPQRHNQFQQPHAQPPVPGHPQAVPQPGWGAPQPAQQPVWGAPPAGQHPPQQPGWGWQQAPQQPGRGWQQMPPPAGWGQQQAVPQQPAHGVVLQDRNQAPRQQQGGFGQQVQGQQATRDNQPRINRQPDSRQVYSAPIVAPFDANNVDRLGYVGPLANDGAGGVILSPQGMIVTKEGQRPVGNYIAGGANSSVYTSSDTSKVKKFVSLTQPNVDPNDLAQTITDQNGGRAILQDIKKAKPDSLFSVAEQYETRVVTTQDGQHSFLMSREENISSPVFRRDNTGRPMRDQQGRRLPVANARGDVVKATNARERIEARGVGLSQSEELTINLVIRDLNQHGIVWTDHKLKNLDVVPDDSSPTGYRVIFFDFDGFRPVKGETRDKRWRAARDIQKAFDNPAQATIDNWGRNDRGWGQVDGRLMQANRAHYPAEVAKQEQQNGPNRVDPFLAFDYTAFGGKVETLATPAANVVQERARYLFYNGLSPDTFKKAVDDYNAQRNSQVRYAPLLPDPIDLRL